MTVGLSIDIGFIIGGQNSKNFSVFIYPADLLTGTGIRVADFHKPGQNPGPLRPRFLLNASQY